MQLPKLLWLHCEAAALLGGRAKGQHAGKNGRQHNRDVPLNIHKSDPEKNFFFFEREEEKTYHIFENVYINSCWQIRSIFYKILVDIGNRAFWILTPKILLLFYLSVTFVFVFNFKNLVFLIKFLSFFCLKYLVDSLQSH